MPDNDRQSAGAGFRLSHFASLEEAEETWRHFEAIGLALPYQTYDWIRAWSDTLLEAAAVTPQPVAVHDAEGAPLLFLPLGQHNGRLRGRPARVLGWLGQSIADQLAPIVVTGTEPLDRDRTRALWRKVVTTSPAADIVRLQHQPDEIYGHQNPLRHLDLRPTGTVHETTLETDWDTYFRSKTHRSRRADSRRRLRRLGEQGRVEFRLVDQQAETEAAIDAMVAQKRRRYRETERPDMFDDDRFDDFYRTFTRRHPDRVRVFTLTVDEMTIATDWGVVCNDTYHGLVTSFEGGDWSRYSPGRLLTEWVLEWCCEQGLATFDFSSGDEPYKEEWCERSTVLRGGTLPVSLNGHLHLAPGRVKRRMLASRLGQRSRRAEADDAGN